MSPVVTVTVSSSLISLLIRSLFQKKSESFDRYRFRIECTFRELKQQTGAFCYRFWSKYLPKLSYYQKKGEPAPMERVEGEKPRQKVLEAVRAIEMHMALSCIAMGILQFHMLYRKGQFQASPLPEDTLQWKGF